MKSVEELPDSEHDQNRSYFGVPKLREEVVEKLARAYTNNYLELDEYEKRVKLSQEAKTVEELQRIVQDFPIVESQSSDLTKPGQGRLLFSLIGDREVLPDDFENNKVSLITVIGDAVVDLSSVKGKDKIYMISSYSLIGDIRVIIPSNVNLVRKHFSIIGDFKRKKSRNKTEQHKNCTVILKGINLIGDVIIIEKD